MCLEPPACPLSWLTGGGSGCQLVLTSRQAPPGLRPDAELCGAGAGISFRSRKDLTGREKGCAPLPLFPGSCNFSAEVMAPVTLSSPQDTGPGHTQHCQDDLHTQRFPMWGQI